MDLPAAPFALAAPETGVAVAVALVLVIALVRTLVLHAQLARRTRELEAELAQRRRVEAELEDARRDLEARVRERTQTLEARNDELLALKLALQTTNERLKRLVAVDPLTGIANRRCFDRALERELRRGRRDGQPVSLVLLDLDGFKRFNDTHGHARGDEVLRLVAQTLDETFRRGGDLVARYGGEEFAIILPGLDARRAGLYAERLRRRIWRLAIAFDESDAADRLTVSGGVAATAPPFVASVEGLVAAADEALYRAKRLGRNRIAVASVEPKQQLNIAS